MANVVVVGAQWGDEGKGKLVDWLSERADVIVRFQGGHNAGHTLVIDQKVYKLSLLPSGIVRGGKLSVIGNGVVLDPWHLEAEIANLRDQGISISSKNLMIAENTPLILPVHSELDRTRESHNSVAKIGTTGRGIGPAYEDKVGRRAIRVADLADVPTLEMRVDRLLAHHNTLRKGLGIAAVDRGSLLQKLKDIAPVVLQFAAPVWKVLTEKRKSGSRILFEGAQGVLLDVDHGTYPFVTSSNTVASSAATGSGCGINSINYVLGITKAYTTRVGEGPFPTELKDDIGDLLGTRGKEFGTVTSRKRRCGWFDGVLVRQTLKISGINGIALTKLDVLDELEEIKICIAYEINGKKYDYLPASVDDQFAAKPIYKSFQGWKSSTVGIKKFEELPENAKNYIKELEKFVETRISSISTSPERNDTILIQDPFNL